MTMTLTKPTLYGNINVKWKNANVQKCLLLSEHKKIKMYKTMYSIFLVHLVLKSTLTQSGEMRIKYQKSLKV